MKGYREKYVASNAWNARAKEFIENGKRNFILFSIVDNSGLEKNQ